MNIKDILSDGEELLVKAQQARYRPGGKEIVPSQIFITNLRIIIETSTMLGIKKDYSSISYADVMEAEIKKKVFSSNIIIFSRFKGSLHIDAIKHNQAQEIERVINEKTSAYRYGGWGQQPSQQPGPAPQEQQKKGFWSF